MARKLKSAPSVSVSNTPPDPPIRFTTPDVVRSGLADDAMVLAPIDSVPMVSVVPVVCVAVPNPVMLTLPL